MSLQFNIQPISLSLKIDLQLKINQKTKPLGSLGHLEELALKVGLIQNSLSPKLNNPAILVFAGDHSIVDAGVSAYPQSVTAQMVLNFLAGGAAISIFAKQHGLELVIVDAGVNGDFHSLHDFFQEGSHIEKASDNLIPSMVRQAHHERNQFHTVRPELIEGQTPLFINAKIANGTQNFLQQPAMSDDQCLQAIQTGADLVQQQQQAGCNCIGFGEMGIGNTSSAALLVHCLAGIPLQDCVGRGTGLDDKRLQHKLNVLQQAAEFHRHPTDPLIVLTTFGGFEIAMMVGAYLKAAELGMVILVDGFIASAALLVAYRLQPEILPYCIFSHVSAEIGHQLLLTYLNAKPLLNLGMRLGEGTGIAVAYPLIQSAVSFLNEMASFADAGVDKASI